MIELRSAGNKGFTLIELLVGFVVVGILAVMAYPAFSGWVANTQYKTAARQVASLLRQARSEAVNSNRECAANFDFDTNKYSLARGNLPSGSTSFTDMIVSDTDFSDKVTIRGDSDCSVSSGNISLQFNPNGSSNTGYICILDDTGTKQYRAGVTVANTGRVVIQRWVSGSSSWEY